MSSARDEVEMIISVNGESTKIPPGFRFHPTEEELLLYYLKNKIASQNKDQLDVIRDIDLNKLEPWDIQDQCKIGSGPQNEWYLFSHKDKKYPTGTRTNRATSSGFWKATGRDKVIRGMSSKRNIGMRKTLVFYKGRAPHGLKSDWIMHEYRQTLDHHHSIDNNDITGDSDLEEGWVVCRVFTKKNMHSKQSARETTNSQCYSSFKPLIPPANDAILDQILHSMGKSCKLDQSYKTKNIFLNNFPSFNTTIQPFHTKFSNLPRLGNVSAMTSPFECDQTASADTLFNEIEPSCIEPKKVCDTNTVDENNNRLNDWMALDRLIASQLNGQDNDTPTHFSCYDNDLQENVSFAQINNDIQGSNQHSSKLNF